MAASGRTLSLADFPEEKIAAIKREAARDADRVALFLNGLGPKARFKRPPPVRFLLHLAAALRLLHWESLGFRFHRDAGLPSALWAIMEAFLFTLNDPDADPYELVLSVMRLSNERLAWSGPSELGVDIVLDEPDEGTLLDVLADFLWESTRELAPQGDTNDAPQE